MTFLAAQAPPDIRTRVAKPEHEVWVPLRYMERGVEFLMERGSAALFWDPGLRKTSVTLEAFRRLRAEGAAHRMLVVAPLRVCQLVWPAEGQKWTQFREFSFCFLHGPKKDAMLRNDEADITLINPEGIPWLAQQFFGRRDLPWDVVVIDELTKFKNHRAQRSKKLRAKLGRVRHRWGLTGTPAPNGYMDLFGQMLVLDDGAALGKHITYFRDQHFVQGYTGFDWKLREGSAERIEEKIAPYVLRMSSDDYLELPPLVDNVISIRLDSKAARLYEEMKQDMLVTLPEGVVTAANAGAVYSKLSQMANGAVYLSDGSKNFVEIHTAKLDALEELIEELAGQQLLIAYEFQHDLARLQERFPDIPTLSGKSGKQAAEIEAAWNRGDLPILLAHPASAGHGLNLQGSGAGHLCWFGQPWDLELYDQFIRRLRRSGTTAGRIVNHILRVLGTIDELKGEALADKDVTQGRFLKALNAEVLRDDPAPIAAGSAARTNEDAMVKKLGFQKPGGGAATPAAEPAARRVQPKGWGAPADDDMPPVRESIMDEVTGESNPNAAEDSQPSKVKPKGWGAPAAAEQDSQREQISRKISAPAPAEDETAGGEEEEVPASVRALEAFPAGVVQQLEGGDDDDDEGGEEETSAAAGDETGERDPWAGLSTRTANALQKAGLVSAKHAYDQGKDALLAGVDRFGEKGWNELAELFEGDDTPEPTKPTPAPHAPERAAVASGRVPKGWGGEDAPGKDDRPADAQQDGSQPDQAWGTGSKQAAPRDLGPAPGVYSGEQASQLGERAMAQQRAFAADYGSAGTINLNVTVRIVLPDAVMALAGELLQQLRAGGE
ncbi:MAG: DEAD/DEAH box helicase [Pigmentiphaga sp.]|nr:DEAD/DEAH box helicase [Pigmentiphaga sp.]